MIDKILRKLSSGQGLCCKKHDFGHVTSLIGRNAMTLYRKISPGLLNIHTKYKGNPPSGFRVIGKSKCGAGGAGGAGARENFSRIQTSVPRGRLILHNCYILISMILVCDVGSAYITGGCVRLMGWL